MVLTSNIDVDMNTILVFDSEEVIVNVADSEIKSLMEQYKQYTVYGLSPDENKASHYVPAYMREHSWEMVGVYPKPHSENGFQIYKSLKEVPEAYRKFVNVFRASNNIPGLVDEILEVGGVEVMWLQLGIENEEAEKRAEAAGIKVVSNHCMIIEHKKWFT